MAAILNPEKSMETLTETHPRIMAWTALAALFIDNEVGPAECAEAAAAVAQAGYGSAEAERMLREEVAPIFAANLWNPAGEWQPWSEADVARIMASQLPRTWTAKLSHRLRVWLVRNIAADLWRQMAPYMQTVTTSP